MTKVKKRHPRIIRRILQLLFSEKNHDTFIGDMFELYEIQKNDRGSVQADLWLGLQICRAVPAFLLIQLKWGLIMLKNYFTVAFRILRQQKGYSFINIGGLALGMTCSILIFMWVRDELNYNRFHAHRDDVYWAIVERTTNTTYRTPNSPAALATHLKSNYPEVVEATRFFYTGWGIQYDDDLKTYSERGVVADPSFLGMFTFPLIAGDAKTALAEPMSIVITEEMAFVCFGTTDVLGKTVRLNRNEVLKITGVLKDVPKHSDFQFKYILPSALLEQRGWDLGTWNQFRYRTFIQLVEHTSADVFSKKIIRVVQNNVPELESSVILHPLNKMHLYDVLDGGGLIQYILQFSALAIFVLIIACINFINLSTARAAQRSKEVGLRKVIGAHRSNLIRQFLGEALMFSMIAFVVAFLAAILFLPTFNTLTQRSLSIEWLFDPGFFTGAITVALLTGLISGIYPAFFLSTFRPIQVLKGTIIGGGRKTFFRKTLVILQFSMSIILLICTLTVSKQLQYFQTRDLGFDKEALIYTRMGNQSKDEFDALRYEMLQHPSLINMTRTNANLLNLGFETSDVSWEGKSPEEKMTVQIRTVDEYYIDTFGMTMALGRFFSDEFRSDATHSYILNETAVRVIGLTAPLQKEFSLLDQKGHIVGVVKDFHHHSMHDAIEPLIFTIDDRYASYMFFRADPARIPEALEMIEKYWDRIDPGYAFKYYFYDERVAALYQTENATGRVIHAMTFIAVLIASLGLYGLTAYMAEQQRKEIGIRKTLGASAGRLTMKSLLRFSKWILMSVLIACPIGWYFMNEWLNNFVYHIDLTLPIFLIAGLLALIIALLTVGYQSIRAARTNPVETLRCE